MNCIQINPHPGFMRLSKTTHSQEVTRIPLEQLEDASIDLAIKTNRLASEIVVPTILWVNFLPLCFLKCVPKINAQNATSRDDAREGLAKRRLAETNVPN